jgi:hypothetical protein
MRSCDVDQLEITTSRVCPVNCKPYCPQERFREAFGGVGQALLSYEDFARAISTVPPEVSIGFAGFSEPFLNPRCVDMMELAHDRGHPLTLYTTLVGARIEDVPRVAALRISETVLHLRDNQGVAKIPDTPEYREVLALARATWPVQGYSVMDVGFASNDRAGNCEGSSPPRVAGPLSCFKLDHPNFVMLPNGDCVLCCMDWTLRHRVGNLVRQPYPELVSSAEYRRVVAQAGDPDGDALCRSCRWARPARKA